MRFILFSRSMTGLFISSTHGSFITRHVVVTSDQGVHRSGRPQHAGSGVHRASRPTRGPRIDPEG